MQLWQETYLNNLREIARLRLLFGAEKTDFGTWYEAYRAAEERLRAIREENTCLLSTHFFPLLDRLPGASREELDELTAFGAELMDWKANLDCGLFVAIHDALLKLSRLRRDRSGVIRELYQLGMGLFYLQRPLVGIDSPEASSMAFHNEMVFTEAASYFRYFDALDSDEDRAYVVRSMANVSICSVSFKHRLSASMRTIRTAKDPSYRAAAPSLPWDTYLRRGYQQLSTLRSRLSDPGITQTEVAAVMDACYEVFKPETASENPSRRWLWPYYEMEFHCGYVGLEQTVERLEKLIRETPAHEYDVSGMYGNVQLPVVYGRMLRDHEKLRRDPDRRRFLDFAYRKMMENLLTVPLETPTDELIYLLIAVITDFYEIPESVSYREVTTHLMQRYAGRLYMRSLTAGELLSCLCAFIYDRAPDSFNRLPVLADMPDAEARRTALLDFASACGFYCDFGLIKMNMERTMQSRNLFENESRMVRLHTVSGYDDLRRRESTARFADVARGHHTPYTGAQDDPSGYVRLESPCRQVTDLAALVSDLLDWEGGDVAAWARSAREKAGSRFSPRATVYLADETLLRRLDEILRADRARCRRVYDEHFAG